MVTKTRKVLFNDLAVGDRFIFIQRVFEKETERRAHPIDDPRSAFVFGLYDKVTVEEKEESEELFFDSGYYHYP